MAPGPRVSLEEARDDQERLKRVISVGRQSQWWKELLEILKHRRQALLEDLAAATYDQRTEDRIRGKISELTFMILLDSVKVPEVKIEVEENDHEPVL